MTFNLKHSYVAVLFIGVLTGCSSAYQGPITPHYDGSSFSNPGYKKESSVAGYLWLRLTESQAKWPETVPVAPQPAPPPRVDDGTARVTHIGHATVLIQLAGLNILTDPIWSDRASMFSFAGPKRVTVPGVGFDALPQIDVVLISHNHYDHLDLPTLRRINDRDKPRVLVPLGNSKLVSAAMPGSKVSEHDWGDRVGIAGKAMITLEPLLHGSGRSPFDQQKTLWAAYVIEAKGYKIYHVGDAGYADGRIFRDTGAKYGGFDLAILPIGAYEPKSFMKDAHMSPVEAVKAAQDVRAKRALAHHFGAFPLGFESFEAPQAALDAALKDAKRDADFFPALKPGEAITLRSQ